MATAPIRPEPKRQKPAYDVAERDDLKPAPIKKPEPINYGPHRTGNGLRST